MLELTGAAQTTPSRARHAQDPGRDDGVGFEVRFTPGRSTRLLVAVAVAFAVVSFVRGVLVVRGILAPGRAHVLDVDNERSISTWYQGVQMAFAGLLLWTVAREAGAAGDRWFRSWALLAVGFAYLSLDEIISIHEKLIRLRHYLPQTGFLYYGWLAVALPVVLAVGALLVPFLRSLPQSTRRGFVAGGAVYLFGAMVLESIGGEIVTRLGADSFAYVVETNVEELVEPLGIILFLHVLARYLQAQRRLETDSPYPLAP